MRFKQAVLTCLLLSATPFAYAHQQRPEILVSECAIDLLANPFYTYASGPFPYDQLKTEHFQPAFDEALELSKKRLEAIRTNPAAPLFENTVEALEFASEPINRVATVMMAIVEMNASKELREVAVKISASYESFFTDITLDRVLKARVQAVVDRGARNRLTEEEKTLLKNTARSFISVPDNKIERLKAIDADLIALGDKFKANVTKETKTFELVVTDLNDLKGLPPSNVEAAATEANEKGKPGSWVFTLDAPSIGPFLTFADNRDLREKLWRVFTTMGAREPYDNRDTILEMVKLRQERAEMLGFKNHAEFTLKYRMAKNVESVNKFLDRLANAYRPKAKAEAAELEKFAGQKIEPWDTAYYLQKMKQQKFGFNANDLKPYFVFDNVLKGAFYAAKRLYGVDFVPKNLPTWHPSVRAFEVFDAQGKHLGYYYFDPFPRTSKRAGAWSTELIPGGMFEGKPGRPHIVNVGNLTPPSAEGELALITASDVRTVFHEMGHALHNLLSKAHYRSLFGNNVAWDFVELPSQLFEKWAMVPEVLDVYARHYQTNERIPEALIQKVKDSENFGNALFGLNIIFKSQLDIDWHSVPVNLRSVEQFEGDVRKNFTILPVNGALTSTSFNHIFPNSYSAGYYSYRWADVSVSDALELFEEKGMFDPYTAFLYHSQVMEKGGSEDANVIYPRFRGRAPDADAFLRHQGLIPPKPKAPKQQELF